MVKKWISIEGTDGVGKTTIGRHLAASRFENARTLIRDDKPEETLPVPEFARSRIRALRSQVWNYDATEPVWEYGNWYWLYTLGSWFWLYFESLVEHASTESEFIITDGWALKHWARFRLHDNRELRDAADRMFSGLPWPTHTLILPPAALSAGTARADKMIKPSELGAFQVEGPTHFVGYQNSTWGKLVELANELDGVRTTVAFCPNADLQSVFSVLNDIGVH